MPPQLPRALPTRRTIDHQIKSVPGARPPAKGPYRMAPFAPLALSYNLGGWKYQGTSGGIVYKIRAAFRSDLSLFPVVISLSKSFTYGRCFLRPLTVVLPIESIIREHL
jgi:hypothetical protein